MGPDVPCRSEEMTMAHVLVAYFSWCPLSILRTVYVHCHYNFKPYVVSLRANLALLFVNYGQKGTC